MECTAVCLVVVLEAVFMVGQTAIYEKSLAQAGITVGKDHSLSLDTDKLKSANIDTLKRILTETRPLRR